MSDIRPKSRRQLLAEVGMWRLALARAKGRADIRQIREFLEGALANLNEHDGNGHTKKRSKARRSTLPHGRLPKK